MLFITLALSLLLVALIVMALKKHQQRRLNDLAERDHVLPPLEIASEDPVAPATPEPPAAPSEPAEDMAGDWKDQCRELRQTLRFEEALACAGKAWPQSQSYEQSAMIIRAAIKHAQQQGSADPGSLLSMLYRAAAEASFLYDKVPGQPEPRWQNIARLYTREEVSKLSLPWDDIGVDQLRLLTKTDRKMMIQRWGEPGRHISAKAYSGQNLKP